MSAPTAGRDLSPEAAEETSVEEPVTPGRVPHFARQRPFGWWLLATGLIGTVASFLLLYERVQLWENPDHITACDVNPWVSCGQVMESWQASSFGFPNIFIGVVAFPVLVAVAVTVLSGVGLPRWYYLGLQAAATFAFGFCVWLWYSAVYSIGVLCPYCMIVWAAVIPFFVVTTARNFTTGTLPSSSSAKELVTTWWWVVLVLIFLGITASILLNFSYAFTV
ncbi:vitamin K epoxide reductase family protein [Nesterenkonia alba]|uniref:vitamin K epoxide reductase family protein n=1 Tax=Nesterenkonia alba TaxID=515814 RepID=UPI0003B6B45D|nr:vitamin K epoxide reductase family protein [Nesterenkonia alba]